MPRKLTKPKKAEFRALMRGGLYALDALFLEENSIGGEIWELTTVCGALHVSLHDDRIMFTMHTRFVDLPDDDDTRRALVGSGLLPGDKGYPNARISHKWNHYAHDDATPEEAARQFLAQLARAIDPKRPAVVVDPRCRKTPGAAA